MNVEKQVREMLKAEGIDPSPNGQYQPTRYLAGMNALYRKRPDLCKGREFVQARQTIINYAKGK